MAEILERDDPAYAGQKHYTSRFLRIYDPLVLRFYSRFVWRCPNPVLIRHYDAHLGRRHLDVGPGTGWFLERAQLPEDFELTLLDPNGDVLDFAARRLTHLNPALVQADVLKPLPFEPRFDSVALNYVLHCLPGPMSCKSEAVRNVRDVLAPGGTVFGATLVSDPERHNRISRTAMNVNTRKGIFDNLEDTEEAVRNLLTASFEQVDLSVTGSVAVFACTGPRSGS
jgi:SAM-dependent methyltransferase